MAVQRMTGTAAVVVEMTVDGSTWRPVVWIDCRD